MKKIRKFVRKRVYSFRISDGYNHVECYRARTRYNTYIGGDMEQIKDKLLSKDFVSGFIYAYKLSKNYPKKYNFSFEKMITNK